MFHVSHSHHLSPPTPFLLAACGTVHLKRPHPSNCELVVHPMSPALVALITANASRGPSFVEPSVCWLSDEHTARIHTTRVRSRSESRTIPYLCHDRLRRLLLSSPNGSSLGYLPESSSHPQHPRDYVLSTPLSTARAWQRSRMLTYLRCTLPPPGIIAASPACESKLPSSQPSSLFRR
ncbi:hypothetical protein DFH09DRAFT_1144661 [Mycena vulgaris]|nr:hypothetical protein DFH09DRAFT_1144661 [Mycena vulgaris]